MVLVKLFIFSILFFDRLGDGCAQFRLGAPAEPAFTIRQFLFLVTVRGEPLIPLPVNDFPAESSASTREFLKTKNYR